MSIRINQLGIDRRTTRLAVIRLQMPPDLRKVDKTVDLAKQVIVRNMPLEAEAVEQRLLHHAHARPCSARSPAPKKRDQRPSSRNQEEFSNMVVEGRSSANAIRSARMWKRRPDMDYFAGLDISMDETHICVLDREGMMVRESKTESTAEAIAGELAKAPSCRRIVFETGRMAPILFHRLNQLGLPVVCVESRQGLPGTRITGDPQD